MTHSRAARAIEPPRIARGLRCVRSSDRADGFRRVITSSVLRRQLVGCDHRHHASTAMLADLRRSLGTDRARAEPLELALYARDAGVAAGRAAAVCFPRTATSVVGRGPRRGAPRPPVRRPGERHRPGGRRHAGRRPARDRHHAAQPDPRGRRRRTRRLGRTRRAQPRPQPGGRAPRAALRARSVVAASVHDRRQRRHERGRAALPRLGGHRRPRARASKWCSPTARSRMLGGLEPDQPGYDLRGCFVGSEGTMGIATRIAVRLTPEPAGGADAAARLHRRSRTPARDGERDHRCRDRPGRAGDDGRRDHPGGRGLRRRGLPARRGGGAARRARRAARTGSHARGGGGGSRVGRGARRADRAGRGGRGRARARCGRAASRRSGRSRGIAPDYYLHDAVVPRTRLVDVLRQVTRSPTSNSSR